MAKAFASTGDMADKTISFTEVGEGLYAFTAEGDPNTGVIIGDDSVMVVDAQAGAVMAQLVIDRIRSVTDKPIKYVVLSHYHAVRVLGASTMTRKRDHRVGEVPGHDPRAGQEDWDSEYDRFPRLFQAAESIPGLTWPTVTFREKMTVHMGKRTVELMHLGRAHTAGDIVAWVPDQGVMFSGDIVEYKSALLRRRTLHRLVRDPGRHRGVRPRTPSPRGAATLWWVRRWSARRWNSPRTSSRAPIAQSPVSRFGAAP